MQFSRMITLSIFVAQIGHAVSDPIETLFDSSGSAGEELKTFEEAPVFDAGVEDLFFDDQPDQALDLALLDETGDPLVASCPSRGKLGARGECPADSTASPDESSGPTLPKIDTLEDLMRLDGDKKDMDTLESHFILDIDQIRTSEENFCPIERPHHLCCVCNGVLEFALCQACTICMQKIFIVYQSIKLV
jgi:hypothetical protein